VSIFKQQVKWTAFLMIEV